MAEITIGPIEGPAPLPRTTGPARPGKSFGETLSESIAQVNELQKAAETAAQDLAVGKSKDIAQTLIAIEKASSLGAYQAPRLTPLPLSLTCTSCQTPGVPFTFTCEIRQPWL